MSLVSLFKGIVKPPKPDDITQPQERIGLWKRLKVSAHRTVQHCLPRRLTTTTNQVSDGKVTDRKIEKLQVISKLAKGNFGEVGLVTDADNHKFYAAKVLNRKGKDGTREYNLTEKEYFNKAMLEDRVLDNVEILKELPAHEHIVEIDLNRKLMGYAGVPLSGLTPCVQSMRDEAEDPYAEVTSIAENEATQPESSGNNNLTVIQTVSLGLLKGLHHLHDNGIGHFDIKPENILVNPAGHVRIADFGCAKRLSEAKDLTKDLGDNHYMPPEYHDKSRGIQDGQKADIWSFGASLYELLADEPFVAKGNILLEAYAVKNSKLLPNTIDSEKVSSHIERNITKLEGRLTQNPPPGFSPYRVEVTMNLLRETLSYEPGSRPDAATTSNAPLFLSEDELKEYETNSHDTFDASRLGESPLQDVTNKIDHLFKKS